MKRSVLALILCVIFFAVGLVIFNVNNESKWKYSELNIPIEENELDIVFGYDTAIVEIFMFSSYSCVFCQKFFNEIFPDLKTNYIDKGILKLIVKPVDITKNANMLHALKTLVCINEFGNSDKLHELLLLEPSVVYTSDFVKVTEEFVEKDVNIAECMLNGEAELYIANTYNTYIVGNIKGTPSFIYNNKIYKGFKPIHFFKEVIEKELKEHNNS